MMKVLFLDFDGVLNTDSYQAGLRANGESGWDDYGQLFDPKSVGNLGRIIEAVPELRIVITSSWKLNGKDELRQMWKERALPGEIYDATPDLFSAELLTIDLSDPENIRKIEGLSKGREISAWLKRHDKEDCQYVILDDLAEFSGELGGHLIPIDPDRGITEEDVSKIVASLN